MQGALSELLVSGIKTTAPFHQKVFAHPAFLAGEVDTHFLERLNEEEDSEAVAEGVAANPSD